MACKKINSFDFSKITGQTKFILDTNVLYFVHSGYYGKTTKENKNYSNFIQKLLEKHCTIIVSAINLQELFFGIENKEYKRYCKSNTLFEKTYTKKDFRKNLVERKKIEKKLSTLFFEITQIYKIIDEKITCKDLENFVSTFSSHSYDPIDYILVKNNASDKDVCFVTDDKDFHYDQGITVITA